MKVVTFSTINKLYNFDLIKSCKYSLVYLTKENELDIDTNFTENEDNLLFQQ